MATAIGGSSEPTFVKANGVPDVCIRTLHRVTVDDLGDPNGPLLADINVNGTVYHIHDKVEAASDKFTVLFMNDQGTLLQQITGLSFGETPRYTGATPEKEHPLMGVTYTFDGWTPAVTPCSGDPATDIVYTAKYKSTANTFTVVFRQLKDGVYTTLKTEEVPYNTAAHAPNKPSVTGYTAGEWEAIGDTTGTSYGSDFSHIRENTTITVQLTKKQYEVKFVDHDGTVLKTQTVVHGGNATAPSNPTWEGHTFSKWDKSFTNVTSALIVNAVYVATMYTVTFVDGFGGTVLETECVYGTTIAGIKPEENPTHEGYAFINWDKSDDYVITENTVVTALWNELKMWVLATSNNSDPAQSWNHVIYSDDNGVTWKDSGAQLSARDFIGFSSSNRRFLIGSTHFAPSNVNDYGKPWFNSSRFGLESFVPSQIDPSWRDIVHDTGCAAGSVGGNWVIGTGLTTDGIHGQIFYSHDNGQTFSIGSWRDGITDFNGYFTHALWHDDNLVVVTGNCPQFEVSTDGGIHWNTVSYTACPCGRYSLIKTKDRFIGAGNETSQDNGATSIDWLTFDDPNTLHGSGNMYDTDGKIVSLISVCYDPDHDVLIGLRHVYDSTTQTYTNYKVYVLDISTGYDFNKWNDIGVVLPTGSNRVRGIKYGNGVVMVIAGSYAGYKVETSSDGGRTWSIVGEIKRSDYTTQSGSISVNDFICGE